MAQIIDETDDEIPPLEDIPNLGTIKPSEIKKSATLISNLPEAKKEDDNKAGPQTKNDTRPANSFGGFKKGFLTNKSNEKPVDNKKEEIVYIKSNPNANKINLKINEDIKDALKGTANDSSKAWLTDDLLEKIGQNDVLRKGFTNNRLLEKVSSFQKNPQAAIKECENDIEAQLFLKEFIKIMGNHLSADKFNVKANDGSTEENEIHIAEKADPEQQKANELINNPEVRELLMDSGVQNLFMLLRNNPENSQKILRNANKEMQVKIQKLISFGLLSTQ